MSHVKTAISIDQELFADAEQIAHKIHISRSRLFELAVKDWLKQRKKELLIEQINAAVMADTLGEEDKAEAEFMRKERQKLAKGEW